MTRSAWSETDPTVTVDPGDDWRQLAACRGAADRVKLAGNAVTPPVMTWIIGRVIQALEAAA